MIFIIKLIALGLGGRGDFLTFTTKQTILLLCKSRLTCQRGRASDRTKVGYRLAGQASVNHPGSFPKNKNLSCVDSL